MPKSRGTLRQKILAFVGALVLLSLLGSSLSLYRITEVNRSLEAINRVSVPLGRLFVQIQSDADLYRRELDHRLGNTHWNDPHWKPRPIPKWIEDVIDSETERASQLIRNDLPWSTPESVERWKTWIESLATGFVALKGEATKLYAALDQKDQAQAALVYPQWSSLMDGWLQQVQWGANEYEHSLRQNFAQAQNQVSALRQGLEIIIVVVVSLSLLLLWLGERALRPLVELASLAGEIARRGPRREDKPLIPEVSLSRNDEVSGLAREFHRMATALLEREKIVESQKGKLQDQNRLLREMGELNKNILHSIHSVLLVTDSSGVITQCNPLAAQWLGQPIESVIGTRLLDWKPVQAFPQRERWLASALEQSSLKIEPARIDRRIFGGQVFPLAPARGAIVVIEDLTDELDLQARLRDAEKLAAVGQMSAQVAHEVRNPLHSIGLEAELASDLASRLGSAPLRESLQSILQSVDRLDKITENYLKLSKLSSGQQTTFDLGEVLDAVLATYAVALETARIAVGWKRESGASFIMRGDRDLLEHVLGNLLKNAIQALDGRPGPRIEWAMGNTESGKIWLRIEDNGPGVSAAIRDKLFTPFATTRAQGTGLGLAFVKKVLEDHGGQISLLPGTKLGGARFEILLPPGPGRNERHDVATSTQQDHTLSR